MIMNVYLFKNDGKQVACKKKRSQNLWLATCRLLVVSKSCGCFKTLKGKHDMRREDIKTQDYSQYGMVLPWFRYVAGNKHIQ